MSFSLIFVTIFSEDRINEIDIDKSIKEFTDMIQILAENRDENQTETREETN